MDTALFNPLALAAYTQYVLLLLEPTVRNSMNCCMILRMKENLFPAQNVVLQVLFVLKTMKFSLILGVFDL